MAGCSRSLPKRGSSSTTLCPDLQTRGPAPALNLGSRLGTGVTGRALQPRVPQPRPEVVAPLRKQPVKNRVMAPPWPRHTAVAKDAVAASSVVGGEFRVRLLTVVHFADDGVSGFADGLGMDRPRPRLAGGAVVGVVTGCSAW